MSATFHLDTKEFRSALLQYNAASKKTWADSVNHQMNNWAIHSSGKVREAMEGKIRSIQNLPWWPKLIAKILRKRRTDKLAAKFWKSKKRSLSRHMTALGARSYTRLQAQRLSGKIIRMRTNARRFLRGFFGVWSDAVSLAVPGIKGRKQAFGGRFKNYIKAMYQPATRQNPAASIHVWYEYKKRSGKFMSKVDAMFTRAMAQGRSMAIYDMEQYANRKMQADAKKFSAA